MPASMANAAVTDFIAYTLEYKQNLNTALGIARGSGGASGLAVK